MTTNMITKGVVNCRVLRQRPLHKVCANTFFPIQSPCLSHSHNYRWYIRFRQHLLWSWPCWHRQCRCLWGANAYWVGDNKPWSDGYAVYTRQHSRNSRAYRARRSNWGGSHWLCATSGHVNTFCWPFSLQLPRHADTQQTLGLVYVWDMAVHIQGLTMGSISLWTGLERSLMGEDARTKLNSSDRTDGNTRGMYFTLIVYSTSNPSAKGRRRAWALIPHHQGTQQ